MRTAVLRSRAAAPFAFLLVLLTAAPSSGDSWAQWQGGAERTANQPGTGLLTGEETAPLRLVEHWRRPFGSGYSALAVDGGLIVSAMASGSGDDVVIALDTTTGRTRWRVRLEKTYAGHDGSHDGPLSSPAIAGGTAYALGARGRLVALDTADGSLRWETHLRNDHQAKPPHYGFAASPLAVDDRVVVQGDGKRGRALFAFAAADGRLLWKSGSESVRYGSPSLMTLAGERQVVVAGVEAAFGTSLDDGTPRWRFPMAGGDFTPVMIGADLVLLLGEEEAVGLRVRKDGQTVATDVAWRNDAGLGGPVAVEGEVFYAEEGDDVVCVEAATGKILWRHAAQNGTLARVDGHIALVEYGGGSLRLIRADASGAALRGLFPLLDQNQSLIGPSMADGRMYLRSRKEIMAVGFAVAEK